MKTIKIKDYYGIYQEIPVSDELYEEWRALQNLGQCVRSEAGRVALDKPGGKRRRMDGFDLFVPVIDSN